MLFKDFKLGFNYSLEMGQNLTMLTKRRGVTLSSIDVKLVKTKCGMQ